MRQTGSTLWWDSSKERDSRTVQLVRRVHPCSWRSIQRPIRVCFARNRQHSTRLDTRNPGRDTKRHTHDFVGVGGVVFFVVGLWDYLDTPDRASVGNLRRDPGDSWAVRDNLLLFRPVSQIDGWPFPAWNLRVTYWAWPRDVSFT